MFFGIIQLIPCKAKKFHISLTKPQWRRRFPTRLVQITSTQNLPSLHLEIVRSQNMFIIDLPAKNLTLEGRAPFPKIAFTRNQAPPWRLFNTITILFRIDESSLCRTTVNNHNLMIDKPAYLHELTAQGRNLWNSNTHKQCHLLNT